MLSAPKDSDVILPLVTSLHIGLDSTVSVSLRTSERATRGGVFVVVPRRRARHRGMMENAMAPDALVGCFF